MPYTLAKFFLWGLLMALAGGVIGWMLRSLLCRAAVAKARREAIDQDEVGHLRRRLANLEPAVAERDRLRMELADVRGSSAGALGFSSNAATSIAPNQPADQPADPPDDVHAEQSETSTGRADDDGAEHAAEPVLDLAAAATIIGHTIKLDDLTVVEGIGPKIGELCNGIGVTTWRQLAGTDIAALQSMLDDAGSRFQMHRPGSWPRQAAMLADGQWAEFKQLTDELDGGV